MKINTISLIIIAELLLMPNLVAAQEEAFIYGRVTTVEGTTYEGPLRWGKEEVFWSDMFNAAKRENKNLKYLSSDEMDYLDEHYEHRDYEWNFRWVSRGWDDREKDYTHQFNCQFGELKSLTPISRKRVEVVLQNGEVREISGVGYNDVGSKIKILDPEMGQIDLDWNKIESIEFIKTPAKLIDNFGEALYGVVETDEGSFTGFVQWDHDERLSTDKLDGDTYDGDVSIPFGKLQSITKIGSSRCDVQLQSGRSFELRGSNDVDSGNRGVIVTIKGLGRVDIPWRSFRKVTFKPAPKASPTYDSFKTQQILKGQVITSKGESLKGKLIFDLDEEYNYEILQGEQEDIEYLIPFRNIERIKPKNYNHSMVFLKNGDELILEESQDVTDKNTGILVFAGKNDPIYIPWEHVEQVKFE